MDNQVLGTLVLLIAGVGAIVVFFLPTIVACNRSHHNKLAIFGTNLLFGFTGIGWRVAMVWALTDNRKIK